MMAIPVSSILHNPQVFWNEYLRTIPKVRRGAADIYPFVEKLQEVMKAHKPGYGLVSFRKIANFWVMRRDDAYPISRLHDRLFETYIRPALSHFAYICHGRLESLPDTVLIAFLEHCELDPRFQDKAAFWEAYRSIMKQKGLVIDDSLSPCIERIYLELYTAKHAYGSVYFECRDDQYILFGAHHFEYGWLTYENYLQFIQPALRDFSVISQARLTQTMAGDFLSFAPRV